MVAFPHSSHLPSPLAPAMLGMFVASDLTGFVWHHLRACWWHAFFSSYTCCDFAHILGQLLRNLALQVLQNKWVYFSCVFGRISGIVDVCTPALKASAEDTFEESLHGRAGSCYLQSCWHNSWELSGSSVARSLLGPDEGRGGIPGPWISPR